MERTPPPWPVGTVRQAVLRAGPDGGEIEWTVQSGNGWGLAVHRCVMRVGVDGTLRALEAVDDDGVGHDLLAP